MNSFRKHRLLHLIFVLAIMLLAESCMIIMNARNRHISIDQEEADFVTSKRGTHSTRRSFIIDREEQILFLSREGYLTNNRVILKKGGIIKFILKAPLNLWPVIPLALNQDDPYPGHYILAGAGTLYWIMDIGASPNPFFVIDDRFALEWQKIPYNRWEKYNLSIDSVSFTQNGRFYGDVARILGSAYKDKEVVFDKQHLDTTMNMDDLKTHLDTSITHFHVDMITQGILRNNTKQLFVTSEILEWHRQKISTRDYKGVDFHRSMVTVRWSITDFFKNEIVSDTVSTWSNLIYGTSGVSSRYNLYDGMSRSMIRFFADSTVYDAVQNYMSTSNVADVQQFESVQKIIRSDSCRDSNGGLVGITYTDAEENFIECDGILISDDGLILTYFGESKGVKDVSVRSDDSRYEAEILRYDNLTGAALIKVDEIATCPARLFSGEVEWGQDISVINGYWNQSDTVNIVLPAIVSGIKSFDNIEYLQTDAILNSKAGGGPVLNEDGQVIGIVTQGANISYAEGITFALSLKEIKNRLNLKQESTNE